MSGGPEEFDSASGAGAVDNRFAQRSETEKRLRKMNAKSSATSTLRTVMEHLVLWGIVTVFSIIGNNANNTVWFGWSVCARFIFPALYLFVRQLWPLLSAIMLARTEFKLPRTFYHAPALMTMFCAALLFMGGYYIIESSKVDSACDEKFAPSSGPTAPSPNPTALFEPNSVTTVFDFFWRYYDYVLCTCKISVCVYILVVRFQDLAMQKDKMAKAKEVARRK